MSVEQLEMLAGELSLGSMLISYPDDELDRTFGESRGALEAHPIAAPFVRLLDSAGGLSELRSHYIDLFDRGKDRVSLYETEYGRMRGMSKGNDLADLAGFYRAFGVDLETQGAHEMLDHVGVELEFYALLVAKRVYLERVGDTPGVEIVEDAQRKFLETHLGAFVQALAGLPRLRDDAVYGPLLGHLSGLVASECQRLSASVTPLDYFADAELEREARCATSLPVLR